MLGVFLYFVWTLEDRISKHINNKRSHTIYSNIKCLIDYFNNNVYHIFSFYIRKCDRYCLLDLNPVLVPWECKIFF